MLKVLLTSKKAWYSDRCKLTWKKKVSKSNVLLYQLQASVLGIKEKEFGLWATPNTMDTLPPRSKEAVIRQMTTARKGSTKPSNLREQVDTETMKMYGWMYPTPKASGQENAESLIKRKGWKKASQHNLTAFVPMYPTPNATNINTPQPDRVEQVKSGGFILRKKNKPHMTYGARLQDVMIHLENKKTYPTPNARDWKDSVNTVPPSVQAKKRGYTLGMKVAEEKKDKKPGGKLNPTFVEFLMGYPMNWTKIEPTE
jgi:hypothetical protein